MPGPAATAPANARNHRQQAILERLGLASVRAGRGYRTYADNEFHKRAKRCP